MAPGPAEGRDMRKHIVAVEPMDFDDTLEIVPERDDYEFPIHRAMLRSHHLFENVMLYTNLPFEVRWQGAGCSIDVDSAEDGDALIEASRYHRKHFHLTLRGDGAGHCMVFGYGDGTAERAGRGRGHAVRLGGQGWAMRNDEGAGSALRGYGTRGWACRQGPGDGDAVLFAGVYGRAERNGAGEGDAIVVGGGHGTAVHEGSGGGKALYYDDGEWELS